MTCMNRREVDGQTHRCELPKGHEGGHKCGWYEDGCYATWSDAPYASGDHDDPATIIEAVREWQEAVDAYNDAANRNPARLRWLRRRVDKAKGALRALRLPPVEEARRD